MFLNTQMYFETYGNIGSPISLVQTSGKKFIFKFFGYKYRKYRYSDYFP